jgi:adenylate kinase
MGLPGVGKSSVLAEAMKRAKSKIALINYGDMAVEAASEKGLAKDRDKLIDLPVKSQLELQDLVVSKLAKLGNKQNIILDTHAVVRRRPVGYIAGLHPVFLKKLKIDGFVFVDAPSEQIMGRRAADRTRERSALSKEEIDEYRLLAKMLISSYAAATGAPFYYISNLDGKLKESADNLVSVIKNIGWE